MGKAKGSAVRLIGVLLPSFRQWPDDVRQGRAQLCPVASRSVGYGLRVSAGRFPGRTVAGERMTRPALPLRVCLAVFPKGVVRLVPRAGGVA
jgi:hypothetical protein